MRLVHTSAALLLGDLAMAYDLHIEGSGKTLEQWLEFVEQEPALEAVEVASATNPKTAESIEVQTPNAARSESGAWFTPRVREGFLVITVPSPDETTIELMKNVAAKFGGKVIGDEGEEY